MSTTTKLTLGPTINAEWQRVAIMEVIKHWNRGPQKYRKRAIKLTGWMLWLLPESRTGEPVVNPLDYSPVVRPVNAACFGDIRDECEDCDNSCCEIFARCCPAKPIDGSRECLVCLGAGWVPGAFGTSRVCLFCDGQGADVEVVS